MLSHEFNKAKTNNPNTIKEIEEPQHSVYKCVCTITVYHYMFIEVLTFWPVSRHPVTKTTPGSSISNRCHFSFRQTGCHQLAMRLDRIFFNAQPGFSRLRVDSTYDCSDLCQSTTVETLQKRAAVVSQGTKNCRFPEYKAILRTWAESCRF